MSDTPLDATLATFVYICHRSGVAVLDARVADACRALDADEGGAGERAQALADAIRDARGTDDLATSLAAIVGPVEALATEGDRDARIAALRRSLFGHNLPWVAEIADRRGGELRCHWVLVESFTDTVRLMDPNPWDDVAEDRDLPIGDFMMRWELAGGRGFRSA